MITRGTGLAVTRESVHDGRPLGLLAPPASEGSSPVGLRRLTSSGGAVLLTTSAGLVQDFLSSRGPAPPKGGATYLTR